MTDPIVKTATWPVASMIATWENETRSLRATNAQRPLTHPLDQGEEGLAMQATRACSITGCDRPLRCKGFCKVHYDRSIRLGTPHLRVIPETCTIDSCNKPHLARGWCGMHWARWKRNGDPLVTVPNPAEITGPGNPSWAGDGIGYAGMHHRLARIRGRAADHRCANCPEPAAQWAYDRIDPHERRSAEGFPYSVDLAHYQPLCLSCHWYLDRPTELPL